MKRPNIDMKEIAQALTDLSHQLEAAAEGLRKLSALLLSAANRKEHADG